MKTSNRVEKICGLYKEIRILVEDEQSGNLMLHGFDINEFKNEEWKIEGQISEYGEKYWVAKPVDEELHGMVLFC